MFGISMPEIIIVLIIALLVIGPKQLPEIARTLGRGYGEFRRMMGGLENSLSDLEKEATMEAESVKKSVDERDDTIVKGPNDTEKDNP